MRVEKGEIRNHFTFFLLFCNWNLKNNECQSLGIKKGACGEFAYVRQNQNNFLLLLSLNRKFPNFFVSLQPNFNYNNRNGRLSSGKY